MTKKISPYLEDMAKYSGHLRERSKSVPRESFLKDFGIQCEFMHCLEILGEISKKIKQIDDSFPQKYPDVPWSSMAKMRDLLLHHYEGSDLETIWNTVKNDIPKLNQQIRIILEKDFS